MTETPNPHIVDADSLTGEMHPIRRVVLSLGSNLGERLGALQGAVNALADTPDFFVTGVSPVYETEPVDAPDGSRPYLNAVLLADTTLPAARLMERALAIEDAFDRERSDIRNAPRTLDVDLIVVGDRRSNEDFLRLPHPCAHERALTASIVVGLALGWAIHPVMTSVAGRPPLVSWAQALVLVMVAAIMGFLAGAAVTAGYVGYAVSWLGDESHYADRWILRSLVAAAGAAGVTLASLALERACRTDGGTPR